jgi:hypothetical protein
VIGNAPKQERRFPLLRWGAMGLAAVMLPLAVLAAIAVGLRTGQYGFTPERLWALIPSSRSPACGARPICSRWFAGGGLGTRVRPLNLKLAFVVCGVALVLATPLVSFNAISTRDQLARLESGKVTPASSSTGARWRFDFGDPGRAALKKLQKSANAVIRTQAALFAKAEVALGRLGHEDGPERRRSHGQRGCCIRAAPLPEGLRDRIAAALTVRATRRQARVLLISESDSVDASTTVLHVHRSRCRNRHRPRPAPPVRAWLARPVPVSLPGRKWEQGTRDER